MVITTKATETPTVSLGGTFFDGIFYVFAPLILATAVFFGEIPLLITISLLGVLFITSYTFAFRLTNRLAVGAVSSISIVASLMFSLVNNSSSADFSILPLFAVLIASVTLMAFLFHICRPQRGDVVNTVGHTVCLSFLVICSFGYILSRHIYDGIFIGFILLTLLPFSMLGIVRITSGLIQHFRQKNFSQRAVITLGFVTIILTTIILRQILPALMPNSIIHTRQIFFASVIACSAYFVSEAQFGSGKLWPSVILRALFGVIISGIFIYLFIVFAGVQ